MFLSPVWWLSLLARLGARQIAGLGIGFLVVASTGFWQVLEYNTVFHIKNQTYHDALKTDYDCTATAELHPLGLDHVKCDRAKLTIRMTPSWAALTEMVNKTWPHSDNIISMVSNVIATLTGSFTTYGFLIAASVFFWPKLLRGFGFFGDVINKGKALKGEKEMQKALLQHSLQNFLQNQQNQQRLTPPPPENKEKN